MSWNALLRSLASCERSKMRANGDTAGPLILLDSTVAAPAAVEEDGGVDAAALDGSARCELTSSCAFSMILDSAQR